MELIFSELTVWHWVALGLVLFGIEMMTGTFDLLMISIAAFATALFAAVMPGSIGGWEGQTIVFGIAAAAMVILGRTVLSGMRKGEPEHPTLNKRMASLIGQQAVAVGDFESGNGRIKLGDTMWGAKAVGEDLIRAGDKVVVEGAASNTAIVRRT